MKRYPEWIETKMPTQPEVNPDERDIRAVCQRMADFLVEKNRAYGQSFSNPIRIFSKASPKEQVQTRIDDKLKRLMSGGEYPGDDTFKDLAGYLLLWMVLDGREKGEL